MSLRLTPTLLIAALATTCGAATADQEPPSNMEWTVDFENQKLGPYTLDNIKSDWSNLPLSNINGIPLSEQSPLRASIVQTANGNALEILYPAKSYGLGTGSGASFEVALPPRDEYTLTYNVEFQPLEDGTFDWKRGGKLPGLSGGSHPSGGKYRPDGFTTRYMWGRRGDLVLYAYWLKQQSIVGDDGHNYGEALPLNHHFKPGQTYELKQHIKLNTPGQPNGLMEIWVDGELKYKHSGLVFREAGASWAIDQFYFCSFHGGNNADWAPPRDNRVRFDSIYVSSPTE
ncbi:polysaccharide lyase [Cerasicoccus frondis]|uniref:polysaccharide lyase n=1 Tax=Cerasicoccus frondis TaxID=490090 RepID=UPI0028528058|nr:hypothetical protein [Cerasicoccus frondis]